MDITQAIQLGHELSVYEDSEKADEKEHTFDALWQSIYDVIQLGTYGIIELEEDEIRSAKDWLIVTQPLTENYKETEIYF